jgi:hypothetical protein
MTFEIVAANLGWDDDQETFLSSFAKWLCRNTPGRLASASSVNKQYQFWTTEPSERKEFAASDPAKRVNESSSLDSGLTYVSNIRGDENFGSNVPYRVPIATLLITTDDSSKAEDLCVGRSGLA